jgi:plasmid maintenance system antidote protein VapI
MIREKLKAAGFSVPSAALAMAVNRANLNNMLLGKSSLSHDMAYRLNVLICPQDEDFDFARAILSQQAAHDWKKTASLRNVVRAAVNAGRKYGEMHEAGADGHLTLTAVGLKRKREAEAEG